MPPDEGLSSEEAEYYSEAYRFFDLNHDEQIEQKELMLVMRSLGMNPTEEGPLD
jgi:Ca2+-binding EF-hand superfamily protein